MGNDITQYLPLLTKTLPVAFMHRQAQRGLPSKAIAIANHVHVLKDTFVYRSVSSQREGPTADTRTDRPSHARMHACLYMCGSSHTSVSAGMTVSVVWYPHKSVQANVCMSHAALLRPHMYVHMHTHIRSLVVRHGACTHLLALSHEGARPHSQYTCTQKRI